MLHENIIQLNDNRQLGFAEYGNPDGLPVFYFHGFPGSRFEAGHFDSITLSNRYRLIGIDRPGMGLSTIDKERTILSWATDVADFANQLGIEKFSIIGHSGGGPFVAACAYAIPERLNGAAIVSGMAPFEKPESWEGLARAQVIANKLVIAIPWFSHIMMKLTLHLLKNPGKMMKQVIKQLPEVDQTLFHDLKIQKSIIDSTLEAFRNGIAGPANEMKLLFDPWGFDLEDVKYPITIWHGSFDKQAPASHAKIYASMPSAQLKMFENEGHHSLLRNYIEEILSGVCPQS